MEAFVLNLAVCSLTMSVFSVLFLLLLKPFGKLRLSKWKYYSMVLLLIGFLMPFKPSFGNAAVQVNTYSTGVTMRIADSQYMVDTFFLDIDHSLIMQLAFIIWLAGAAVHLINAAAHQIDFNRKIRRISKPASETAEKIVYEICDKFMIWTDIKVLTIDGINSAMAVGIFKPIILIPDRKYSNEELRLIIKHEIVHFKHRDLIVAALSQIAASIHWFNPLVRIFIRSLERECELYCDETVMRDEDEAARMIYCRSILDASRAEAVGKNTVAAPSVSSGFFLSKSGMKRRLSMILCHGKKCRFGFLCIAAAVAVTVLSGSLLSFGNSRTGSYNLFPEEQFAVTSINYNTEVSFTTFEYVIPNGNNNNNN